MKQVHLSGKSYSLFRHHHHSQQQIEIIVISEWLYTDIILLLYMLWFNFIPGLNFIFICLKLIIIQYHTQKQRENNI